MTGAGALEEVNWIFRWWSERRCLELTLWWGQGRVTVPGTLENMAIERDKNKEVRCCILEIPSVWAIEASGVTKGVVLQ